MSINEAVANGTTAASSIDIAVAGTARITVFLKSAVPTTVGKESRAVVKIKDDNGNYTNLRELVWDDNHKPERRAMTILGPCTIKIDKLAAPTSGGAFGVSYDNS